MSKETSPLGPYEVAPEHQGLENLIAYSIRYSWGNVHVSKTIRDGFDLYPLTVNPVPGYESSTESTDNNLLHLPKVQVLIVGSGELDVLDPEHEGEPISSHIYVTNTGLEVVAAISGDKKSVAEQFFSMAEKDLGQDRRYILENVHRFGSDVPLDEDLNNLIPHIMIHAAIGNIAFKVIEPLEMFLEVEKDKRFFTKIHKLGAFGLLASGGISAAALGLHEPVEAVGFGLGYMGSIYLLASKLTQKYLRSSDDRQKFNKFLSFKIAMMIGDEIHDTFCWDNFDRQIFDETTL